MVSGLTYFFYFAFFDRLAALFFGIFMLAFLARIRERYAWQREDAGREKSLTP